MQSCIQWMGGRNRRIQNWHQSSTVIAWCVRVVSVIPGFKAVQMKWHSSPWASFVLTSDPRKPPDWFFSRLGSYWVLKSGYPKLSLCRLYCSMCPVASGAENDVHLHRLQGYPLSSVVSMYMEPCSLHAYPWLSQKQAILNGGMSSKGRSHPLVLNLVLSHCSHKRLAVSICS